MSVLPAAAEQARSLLRSGKVNRQQLAELKRLGNFHGEDPTPSGYRDGEPYWTADAVIKWSETAKRSRSAVEDPHRNGVTS